MDSNDDMSGRKIAQRFADLCIAYDRERYLPLIESDPEGWLAPFRSLRRVDRVEHRPPVMDSNDDMSARKKARLRFAELWMAHDRELRLDALRISRRVDRVVEADSLSEGTSQAAYFDIVFQKSRPLLYDDKYEDRPPQKETQNKLRGQTARTEFFANLGSVEELKYFMFKMKRILHYITDTTTKSTSLAVGFHNFSVSEEFRLAVLSAINSKNWEEVESMIMPIAAAFPGRAAMYDAFIIAATLLLSVVYQYLISLVDRGGGRTDSSGSLEFRSIYISIVLFQGAYVWIKFRDVAPESAQHPPPGVYRRSKVNELGVTVYYGNHEPRFKPPGSNYISVGSYEEEEDAKTLYQILSFYYDKNIQGELPLLGGSTYPIPPMTEEERRFDPAKKRNWVKGKAKEVFEEYKGVMDSFFMGCLMHPEPREDFLDTVPLLSECPDVGAAFGGMASGGVEAEAHPFVGNQTGDDRGDDLQSACPGICIPDEGPVTRVPHGMQLHMANDTLSGDVVGDTSHSTLPELSMRSVPEPTTNIPASGAAVSCEQPLEIRPPEIHRSWQENQVTNSAMNVIPDDHSLRRQVKELQRRLQFQQRRILQLESRISLSEQQQYQLMSQLEFRFVQFQQHQQHQQIQIEQRQQLQTEHLESRISALEEELERSRSTEHDRKRSCFGLHPHN